MKTILLAGVVLAAAIAFALTGHDPQIAQVAEPLRRMETVKVQELSPMPKRDTIVAFGQVQARWMVTLKSEATGRVVEVSDSALTGSHVEKGATLVVIEDTAQRLDLSNHLATLAQTERALAEERQRARLAEENWRASGYRGDPDPLVLREPQLAEAQAKVQSAQLAVERAQYLLDQTRITAPFSGAITQRSVSPGDFIQPGTEILQLYDNSIMEVTLPVSEAEISRLAEAIPARVLLTSEQQERSWTGVIQRVGKSVDTKNQWINLIVGVSVADGLIPGQFLKAEIAGKSYDAVIAIPEALVGRDGAIWRVTPENLLQRIHLEPIFVHDGFAYVTTLPEWGATLRLTQPRDDYLDGVEVQPEAVDGSIVNQDLRDE